MLRSTPFPQADREGVAWIGVIKETARLVDYTPYRHRDSLAYPQIISCISCSVPLEDGQVCFHHKRDQHERFCLDCMYAVIKVLFPEMAEPPTSLIVSAL